MNERLGDEKADEDFELADELRGQKKMDDRLIPISEDTPDQSKPATPPRLGGFRPSEPNE